MAKEPLYPHVPKRKPWDWSRGERALYAGDEKNLRDIYIVEIVKDMSDPHDLWIPMEVRDILSSTTIDIKVGSVMFASSCYALYRDFASFAEGKTPRLRWLQEKGIELGASVYHYRSWKVGDLAWYIDASRKVVCGVEVKGVEGNVRVAVLKVVVGDLDVGYLSVPASALYESFRHYVSTNPISRGQWLTRAMEGPIRGMTETAEDVLRRLEGE